MPKVASDSTQAKRSRGRPRKTGEEKKSKEIPTPDYGSAFEAAMNFATMDFMLKQQAKNLKEVTKAKSECQKLVKAYFKGHPDVEAIGPIECTRKEKKHTANLDEVKKAVEEEIMQNPHRAGEILAQAISDRITKGGGEAEEPLISIKITKGFNVNGLDGGEEEEGPQEEGQEEEDEEEGA